MKAECFCHRPHRSETEHGQRGTQFAAKKRPNLWKEGQFPGSCCQRSCKRKEVLLGQVPSETKMDVLGTLTGLSQIRYGLYVEWILSRGFCRCVQQVKISPMDRELKICYRFRAVWKKNRTSTAQWRAHCFTNLCQAQGDLHLA